MIKAFERGDEVNDYQEYDDDPTMNKYLHEFKKVEEVIGVAEEEGQYQDDEDYGEEDNMRQPETIAVPKTAYNN